MGRRNVESVKLAIIWPYPKKSDTYLRLAAKIARGRPEKIPARSITPGHSQQPAASRQVPRRNLEKAARWATSCGPDSFGASGR